MNNNRFALTNRAMTITTIAVLGMLAVLIAPQTPARAADGRPTPVLAEGAGMGAHPSAGVRVVQRALDRRGYDLGAPGVDGRFGPLTAAAVRHMQADYGLAVDGIVGRHTRKALGLTRNRQTQASSRAEHRKAVHEREPTSAQNPDAHGRTTAGLAGSRQASIERTDSSSSWFDALLAGVIGGLITLALVACVAVMRGQRRRARPRRIVSPRLSADEPRARSADQMARVPTPQIATNGTDKARPTPNPRTAGSPPPRLRPGNRMIGYMSVSADREASEDDEAAAAMEASCKRSGWRLLEIVRDRDAGATLERPALGYALKRIADRQAEGLVVTDLRRLSRSIADLGALMAWFRDARATLVALDLDIDTSTAKGHQVASVLIALSTHKHERIAQRTRPVVAEFRRDRPNGRPAVRHDPDLLERIAAMRAANMTLQAIADRLNAEGVPTLRGGSKWRPSSIQGALGYRRPAPRDRLPSLAHRGTGA